VPDDAQTPGRLGVASFHGGALSPLPRCPEMPRGALKGPGGEQPWSKQILPRRSLLRAAGRRFGAPASRWTRSPAGRAGRGPPSQPRHRRFFQLGWPRPPARRTGPRSGARSGRRRTRPISPGRACPALPAPPGVVAVRP
jgi:hypothetical protein